MSTTLEQLLADIDPSKTYDLTFARADDAMNSFSGTTAQITDWDEFTKYMAEFTTHVEAKILSTSWPGDHDFNWGRCSTRLTHIYGPNGHKAAFEMTRTGNEGGLYAVLKAVALRMAEEYAKAWISTRISDFLDKLTVDEQFSVMDEYLKKYGHLLPSELTEGNAARIRGNFRKALAQHPEIIRKIRHLSR